MKYIYLILIAILLATTSCKPDDKALFDELTNIASSGIPEAQYHLGMLYNNGIGTKTRQKHLRCSKSHLLEVTH